MGVQVHGGMGFVEETGAAQFSRDVRVTAIYEGTNGIQAMDLVGRKLSDGGAAARALLGEIAATAEAGGDMGVALAAAAVRLGEATDWMLATSDFNDRAAGCVPYLRAWGLTLGAHYLLKGATADPSEERKALARFFIHQMLPKAQAELAAATQGAEPLYALSAEKLTA